jgi:archaemetzincin
MISALNRNPLSHVIIHPFGKIEGRVVEAVRAAVEERFHIDVTVGNSLVVPARAYSANRGQYRSTTFLDKLSKLGCDEGRIRLGIVVVDLFVPELNFVFGEASPAGHVAVFSLARLDPRKHQEGANSELLAQRAAIEAIHELGHVLGLDHCRRRNCVMWFSNMLAETDHKGSHFCRECAAQLGLPSQVD